MNYLMCGSLTRNSAIADSDLIRWQTARCTCTNAMAWLTS